MLCANVCTYKSESVSVCAVRFPLFSGRPGRVEDPVRLTTAVSVCAAWACHTGQVARNRSPGWRSPFQGPLHTLDARVHHDSPCRRLVSLGTEALPSLSQGWSSLIILHCPTSKPTGDFSEGWSRERSHLLLKASCLLPIHLPSPVPRYSSFFCDPSLEDQISILDLTSPRTSRLLGPVQHFSSEV